jgi:hypothetical protein
MHALSQRPRPQRGAQGFLRDDPTKEMSNARLLSPARPASRCEAHAPFGGVKNSGFGREGGRFSMEEMTELKWITIQSGQGAFPI